MSSSKYKIHRERSAFDRKSDKDTLAALIHNGRVEKFVMDWCSDDKIQYTMAILHELHLEYALGLASAKAKYANGIEKDTSSMPVSRQVIYYNKLTKIAKLFIDFTVGLNALTT